MKIETSSGKVFDIRVICSSLRKSNTVLIELYDDRPLALVAADFDGLETFTKTYDNKPGVKEMYEGYSQLVSIQRNTEDGTVRLMLEKDVGSYD